MFERLTRWEDNDKDVADLIEEKSDFDGLTEAINRLAEYEDSGLSPEEVQELAKAKADGRLVVLPCKVGDKIWYLRNGCIDYGFVKWFETDTCGEWTVVVTDEPRGPVFLWFRDFGKTAFLSKEAAEKALGGGEE